MNSNPIRILILTGSYGEGHNQAAHAIQEAVADLYPQAEVRVLDFMHWTHPKLDSVAQYVLYQSFKKIPSLYGYLYKATDLVSSKNMMVRPLQMVGRSRLLSYVKEFNPHWILSTFPHAASVCARMKQLDEIQCKTATVITDLHPHSQWIHPSTDRYFVGTEHVRYLLRKRGIPRGRIQVTGIPVRRQFSPHNRLDSPYLKIKLGLNPEQPFILVTGGGAGIFSDLPDCLELIVTQFPKLQIVVICGHNEALRVSLKEMSVESNWGQVTILGFVENIDEYMAGADLVIGKSGGVTTSETLAIGTPMMIYRPLPGQETYNAKVLVRNGAALLARNPFELIAHLSRLAAHKELLKSLQVQAKQMGRGQASYRIAELLLGKDSLSASSGVAGEVLKSPLPV